MFVLIGSRAIRQLRLPGCKAQLQGCRPHGSYQQTLRREAGPIRPAVEVADVGAFLERHANFMCHSKRVRVIHLLRLAYWMYV